MSLCLPPQQRSPYSGTQLEPTVAEEGTVGTSLGGGTHLLKAGDFAGFQGSHIQHQGGPEAEDLP